MPKEKKDGSIYALISEAKSQQEFNLLIKSNVGECSDEVLELIFILINKQNIQ